MAAYIVRANSIQTTYPANDYLDADWKATVPQRVTKTKEPYKWAVPKDKNHLVDFLRGLHKKKGFLKELGSAVQFNRASGEPLCKRLSTYWTL